jgi:hypothetical protein
VDTPTPASSGGRLQRDQGGIGISPLAPILDLSLLKYAQRDALVEVLQRCRGKVGAAQQLLPSSRGGLQYCRK